MSSGRLFSISPSRAIMYIAMTMTSHGAIWAIITVRTRPLRPLNLIRAMAKLAARATSRASATAPTVTRTLLVTYVQKFSTPVALVKLSSVGVKTKTGSLVSISLDGLSAEENIQYTGKTKTRASRSAPRFLATAPGRTGRRLRSCCAGFGEGFGAVVVVLTAPPPASGSGGSRRT